MSLTGILLDVSGSMRSNIESGTIERGTPWAQSIFKVIDDLIEHDVSSENRVFAIGVGGNSTREIFDVIGSVQQIENMEMPHYRMNMPATEYHVDEILDILERNGARNIRKWVKDITVIRETVSDYRAALILKLFESDEEFLRKFVNEALPPGCRDRVDKDDPSWTHRTLSKAEDAAVETASFLRPATIEDIHEVVEKTECYFLKDVGTHSIFSVKDASRIIRGCVDEKELSTERELLESVEPFIYGRTPFYESLQKATKLFKGETSKNKLLFVLSDGDPTDGSNDDSDKISQITSQVNEAGVKIVSCFITRSTNIYPKRLYDEMQLSWESGAKFLFSLSSKVSTQYLPRAILVKRGWTIDVSNNETKLFIQVNHPDNLRYRYPV